MRRVGSLCLSIYHLDLSNKKFSGCIKIEASAILVKKTIELGCFQIPVSRRASRDLTALIELERLNRWRLVHVQCFYHQAWCCVRGLWLLFQPHYDVIPCAIIGINNWNHSYRHRLSWTTKIITDTWGITSGGLEIIKRKLIPLQTKPVVLIRAASNLSAGSVSLVIQTNVLKWDLPRWLVIKVSNYSIAASYLAVGRVCGMKLGTDRSCINGNANGCANTWT